MFKLHALILTTSIVLLTGSQSFAWLGFGSSSDKNRKPAATATKDKGDQYLFAEAVTEYQAGQYDTAAAKFAQIKSENLSDYISLYYGYIAEKKNNFSEARHHFEKALNGLVNFKLESEAQFHLAKIDLEQKNWKSATQRLSKLDKKMRGEILYPDVLYHLWLAQKHSGPSAAACKSIKKLWIKYPNYEPIANWGLQLTKATGCSCSNENKRDRIRSLQWSGLGTKAQQEIQQLKAEVGKSAEEEFAIDRLEVAYALHEGEAAQAMDILKKYYNSRKNDVNYLLTLASVSSKSGDVATAVGSYYRAYKMNPRGKNGRFALFQAAFMSYQFQDYDGASRKFKEFTKVFPKSGLSRDAQWHLAWIRYLRADYAGALKSFAQFDKKNERVIYWQAMSHWRLGEYEKSRQLFTSLQKDNGVGYYSVASQQRLQQLNTISPRPSLRRLAFGRGPVYAQSGILLGIDNDNSLSPVNLGDESETEESVVQNLQTSGYGEVSEESPELSEANTENTEETTDKSEENLIKFTNAQLVKKFDRAREMMAMGFQDWARWDLYDIEKRTSQKDILKSLIKEYESLGLFHRSSYIGQTYFGSQMRSGMDTSRSIWESTYPKAYNESVHKFSREFEVPSPLIWGIMRAESQYKKDAISPVGAMGLMQVMPLTGQRVAQLLKDSSFQPIQLLEAPTAIKIGSRYLQRLAKKFEKSIPLIAASYNAGPHRTRAWVASFGHLDMDEFIEHIPYLETRNYVKKVVSNVAVYSKLYPQNDSKNLISGLNEPLKFKQKEPAPLKETWEDI